MADRTAIESCFDDTTTRTLEAHRDGYGVRGIGWCRCDAPCNTSADWRAHVAVELRTALVDARIPEPCPDCQGKRWVQSYSDSFNKNAQRLCGMCGGVGTIPGEELLVAMTGGTK